MNANAPHSQSANPSDSANTLSISIVVYRPDAALLARNL
jgi:hypothetical protein